MSQPMLEFVCAMAYDDDDGFDATRSKIIDAGFDDCLVAKGKQRFERAHPF